MISIIIPVYNAASYIEPCLRSIMGQTSDDYELVLVDDGSTDDSASICRRYAKECSRVTFVQQANGGAYSARRTGLKHSAGEYVWFVDSDDFIAEDSVEIITGAIEERHPDIVQFGCAKTAADGVITYVFPLYNTDGYYDSDAIESEILPNLFYTKGFYEFGVNPGLWNKAIKKRLAVKYFGDIDSAIFMGEDGIVTYQCYLCARSVYVLNSKVLYYYRDNGASVCNTSNTRDYINQNIALFDAWDVILQGCAQRDVLLQGYSNYVFFLSWHALMSFFESLRNRGIKGMPALRAVRANAECIQAMQFRGNTIRPRWRDISVKRRVLNLLFERGCYRLLYLAWSV